MRALPRDPRCGVTALVEISRCPHGEAGAAALLTSGSGARGGGRGLGPSGKSQRAAAPRPGDPHTRPPRAGLGSRAARRGLGLARAAVPLSQGPPRGQHGQRGRRAAPRCPRPALGNRRPQRPGRSRAGLGSEGTGAARAPRPSSARAAGAPYLRDNAKAGRFCRASLTHRAAITAAGTARARGMR